MWVQQREQIRKEKCKAVLTTSDLEHAYSCSAHQLPSLLQGTISLWSSSPAERTVSHFVSLLSYFIFNILLPYLPFVTNYTFISLLIPVLKYSFSFFSLASFSVDLSMTASNFASVFIFRQGVLSYPSYLTWQRPCLRPQYCSYLRTGFG